jgi:oxygen-dependent protoporphyrinogen oxidase
VQPLVAGIFVGDARKLSLAATYPEFLQAEREHGSLWRAARAKKDLPADDSAGQDIGKKLKTAAARYGQFVTFRRGIHTLIEALVETLPRDSIRLNVPAQSITRAADGRWSLGFGDGQPFLEAEGVILATPAPHSARLIRSVDRVLGEELKRIEYASSVVVTLVYYRKQITHPLDGFGVVVPDVEGRPILAASFLTVKFPTHSRDHRAVIRIFMGGALNRQIVERDDEELISIARQQLAELLGAQSDPIDAHIARWRESMPQYHVGHVRLVESIEQRVAAHPRLQLAGNAYHGVGIPQCIHSGRIAAEKLAKQLK